MFWASDCRGGPNFVAARLNRTENYFKMPGNLVNVG
jgi:hypothetical protein